VKLFNCCNRPRLLYCRVSPEARRPPIVKIWLTALAGPPWPTTTRAIQLPATVAKLLGNGVSR
jgi:hypothetical protein